MYTDSHRYLRSNTPNHLVESHVGTSRAAIKADLVDKIVYDDPAVFKRLRVDQVDRSFVATCVTSFDAANAEDISLLMELVERASKKTPEELEIEETNDTANDLNKEERSGNHGSSEEKKMYDPLVRVIFSNCVLHCSDSYLFQVRLFNFIAYFGHGTAPRRFQKTNGMLKADELHTFGFPSCSPDITISQPGIDASRSKLWRDWDAFGKVKPLKKQGPKSTITGTIPAIVTQSADYMRLFMSARPFMLFYVGILIFGTEFCVGIFDHDGITFSPAYDMFQDTETFIRVVRSLACNLSIKEIGYDPTVRVLTHAETQKLTGSIERFPHTVVSSGGSDPRQWCTIGPPIWTSLSFSGCGTNIWRVREYVVGVNQEPLLQRNDMIMKTAWRSSARTPESDIYMSIDQFPEGLAKFECGGDVKYAGYPITVQNLRSHPVHNFLPEGDINPPTPVLHHLILSTVGRPLWEYKSDFDLLAGFRDALKGECLLIINCDDSSPPFSAQGPVRSRHPPPQYQCG